MLQQGRVSATFVRAGQGGEDNMHKQRLYHIKHTQGSLMGQTWPVIYRGEEFLEHHNPRIDGRVDVIRRGNSHNLIYLQSTRIGDFRLAQMFVLENNYRQEGKTLIIQEPHGVSYSTGERIPGGERTVPFFEYWLSLSRLVLHHWSHGLHPFKKKISREVAA